MILNWALKTFPWAKLGKLLFHGWMWIIIPLKQKKIRECFNGWISQPTAVNLIFQPTMASIHKGELEHKICYTLHIISWTLISFFSFFLLTATISFLSRFSVSNPFLLHSFIISPPTDRYAALYISEMMWQSHPGTQVLCGLILTRGRKGGYVKEVNGWTFVVNNNSRGEWE